MVNTQQIAEQLKAYNSLAIIAGGEPSVDTLGSALALSLAIASTGKTAQVYTKNPIRAEHSRLVGCDKVETKAGGQKNFVITLPNAVDVIEKVSCYAEGQKLNIVLQPYADVKEFNPQDIQYAKVGGNVEAVILIDVQDRADAQAVFADQPDIFNQVPTFAIGKVGDNRTPTQAIDPTASATSQVIMQLLRDMRVQLTADTANNLLQALYGATDDFHSPAITSRVFEDAAYLLKLVHRESGPQRSPIAPPTLPGQRDPFDYFAPPMPGAQPAAPRQAAPLPPLPPLGNPPVPANRPPMPQNPPVNRPAMPPMNQGGRSMPELPPIDFGGADDWEIDQDLEFDKAPDQTFMGEGAGGQAVGRPAPTQGRMPQQPRPAREVANPRPNQPGQNQPHNRQQQKPHGQQQAPRGQQQPNQGKKDNRQPKAAEDDWLSPKIYKTEDLM